MTPKFNHVVGFIEESEDISTLSVNELQSTLLGHEQLISYNAEEKHALKVTRGDQSKGWGRGCGSFRGRGYGRGRQGFNKQMVECYSSYKLGHFHW